MRRKLAGRRLAIGVAFALSVAVGGAAAATAEIVTAGNLILNVGGGFKPHALPKHRFAPITLSMSADLSTVDGNLPPIAKHLTIEFDRNGRMDKRGLPVCQPARLENTVVAAARKACRQAIVGKGFADAKVLFPEDTVPIDASSPITVFNGPGNKVIVHAYTTIPVPTTFVVPVTIRPVHDGRYGLKVDADVPPISGGYGHLVHIDIKVNRRWRFHGRTHSFATARCADGRLQATGTGSFNDGTVLTGTVLRRCTSRG